jgi:hypothetical protein
MADTGAPWSIPYAEPADTVRTWPALSEDVADAIVAGLDVAAVVRQVKQVITTTNFTTTSATAVDLTGVSVTIVPTDAAHRIVMWFTASVEASNADRESFFQFRRDTTDLFEDVEFHHSTAGDASAAVMVFDEVAGSTTSRDYLIRAHRGTDSTTITVVNSSLIVMEYSV